MKPIDRHSESIYYERMQLHLINRHIVIGSPRTSFSVLLYFLIVRDHEFYILVLKKRTFNLVLVGVSGAPSYITSHEETQ